ncbi:hypothetical protein [Paenibacillus zanthoxyli]|uniref:hypothetical protein n=1 Tax=Paenibacillus zanthoxyli TaxID=369399 RepID=UPI00047287A0|nr:hypothetical protein [Paenibacillus zanthoxyli]
MRKKFKFLLIRCIGLSVSALLGILTFYFFISLFLSNKSKIIPVIIAISFVAIVFIIGGPIFIMNYLKKFTTEKFIGINILIFFIFFIFSPFMASIGSEIKDTIAQRSLPDLKSRQEIYQEINKQLQGTNFSYQVDIKKSEDETIKDGRKLSIILKKQTEEELDKEEIYGIIKILPLRALNLTMLRKNGEESIVLLLDKRKGILNCFPNYTCERFGIYTK